MKITKKLLERHGMGLCSEDEKRAIEKWFETLDDPSQNLTVEDDYDDNSIWSKMSQAFPELENRMSASKVNKIILFQRSLKYAAAACFVLVVFLGGRFSVGTATANPTPKDPTADNLFIYGSNGSKASVPGLEYKIKFDGQVKLFNGSMIEKRIRVGEKTFTLNSNSTYYLTGTINSPVLFNHYSMSKREIGEDLKGDFSILRIDR